MADRRSSDPVDRMVRQVFSRMRVKYPLYWPRRVDTPDKLRREREQWRSAVDGLSLDQFRDGLHCMRGVFRWRPPTASEFRRMVERRSLRPVNRFSGQYVDPVVDPKKAKEFFDLARELLK